jgi:hypothetical protein
LAKLGVPVKILNEMKIAVWGKGGRACPEVAGVEKIGEHCSQEMLNICRKFA